MSFLSKERVEARAALRPLKQPLYDTGHIILGATNRVNFFQAPQGQPIVAAGALKTEADTNLTQSGMLGRPQEFDLYGFNLEVAVDMIAAEDDIQDFSLIYENGVFEFYFGQQRPWLQVPVQEIPHGTGLEGALGTADDAAALNYFLGHNGLGSSKQFYNFTIGKKPIPIGSAENFNGRLDFPAGAITCANLHRARCYMKGVLYSAL